MLTKHTEIEIPVDNPFVNDKLERRQIAENLTRLVQSTNQTFVISIEAPWGWGKTTFIKMWRVHLESLGHTCLYFNAWENDFVEDPLIAFVGEISKALVDKKTKSKAGIQLKKLQAISGKIVRRTLPAAIQIVTHGILSQEAVKQTADALFTNSDEIAKLTSEMAEEKIKQYESDKNGILEFKKELAKFTKSLSEDGNKKTPLVFFVDELDRCRPDFSISLLERIKHVFTVDGIVFVLGISRDQIEQSVKSLYGQNTETDGYLKRFIDYSYKLPKPQNEAFPYYLSGRFNLDEVFGARGNYREQKLLLDSFAKLSQIFNLSLRAQEQCFTEINLVYRTTSPRYPIFPISLAFLVTLKAYNKPLFEELYLPAVDIEKFLELFRSSNIGQDFLRSHAGIEIESALMMDYLTNAEKEERHKKLEEISKSENHPEKKRSLQILDWVSYTGGVLRNLLQRIDITKNFDI